MDRTYISQVEGGRIAYGILLEREAQALTATQYEIEP